MSQLSKQLRNSDEDEAALRSRVEGDLLAYLEQRHAEQCPPTLTVQTQLLETGIIDSLSMMVLILFLENRYRLDFLRIEVRRDDFRSVAVIADLVVRGLRQ